MKSVQELCALSQCVVEKITNARILQHHGSQLHEISPTCLGPAQIVDTLKIQLEWGLSEEKNFKTCGDKIKKLYMKNYELHEYEETCSAY